MERGVLLIALALLAAEAKGATELIDRRRPARGAFLATPEGVYRHYCSHCHGEDAEGAGRLWAAELTPKPTDLSATALDEAALVEFITGGSAAAERSNLCPPWGHTLSTPDIARLSRYILALSGRPPPQLAMPSEPAAQSVPWWLVLVIVAQVILLWRVLRHRKDAQG